MRKNIWIIVLGFVLAFASCKKEVDFSDNNSLKLAFSTDTITFDTVFTSIGSSTRQLMIYNDNNENLKISSIRLESGNMSQFAVNIDGESGYDFSDIEIYSKDSIFVFVRYGRLLDPRH